MKKFLQLSLILGVLFISSTFNSLFSQEVISPSHDSYVHSGKNSQNNYGTDVDLRVKSTITNADNSRKTVLQFDLSAYDAVESAVLRLYCFKLDSSMTISVLGTTDDWTEGDVNWDTGLTGDEIASFDVINEEIEKYYECDITAYADEQAKGDKIVSLLLDDLITDFTDQARFNSKEADANYPELVVTAGTETGISELGVNNSILTYPNPAQGFINISSKTELGSIVITSINGQELLKVQSVNQNEYKLNLNGFSSGLYFLKTIDIEGKVSVNKISKQ